MLYLLTRLGLTRQAPPIIARARRCFDLADMPALVARPAQLDMYAASLGLLTAIVAAKPTDAEVRDVRADD
jgi:hypothetical protein